MDMAIQDDADNERDRFLHLRFALFIYLFIYCTYGFAKFLLIFIEAIASMRILAAILAVLLFKSKAGVSSTMSNPTRFRS